MNRPRQLLFLTAALLFTAGTACAGGDSEGGGGGGVANEGTNTVRHDGLAHNGAGAPARAAQGFQLAAPSLSGSQGAGPSLPDVGPRVIKTADLSIRVARDEFSGSVDRATTVAGRYGGFVLSTTVDDATPKTSTLVLRVPAESFESALSDLKGLGDVKHEEVSGQDVSAEYIDLQARLRNFRAQEAVLLRLMNRAQTVSDTIRVQSELQPVQLEIERLRGRIRFLDDQTDMSTITMSLVQAGPSVVQSSTLAKSWRNAVRISLSVLSALIVSLGVIIPVGALAGVGLLVFRTLRPRLAG